MTGGRLRVLLTTVLFLIVAAAIALHLRAPTRHPRVLLLSSLPLVFGEEFSVTENGSPALEALRRHFTVVPISVTSPQELAKADLLMMAQPPAQPAEDLVALDAWVRGGGRLLLFADPWLEWPSKRPLGDPLRPLPSFADTGLLGHWGLRLEAPAVRGPRTLSIGSMDVLTVSPGKLTGRCSISANGLVAWCRVAKGRVTVVADADLLDVPDLGSDGRHNLEAVVQELALLARN